MENMEELALRSEGISDLSEKEIDNIISRTWKREDITRLNRDIKEARPSTQPAKREIVRKLGQIPIDLIVNNIEQPRFVLFENQDEFDDMVRSIKTHGNIKRPIIVIPFKKGFMLKDGQRRLMTSRVAGIKKIFSIIEYAVDENGHSLPISRVELLEDAVVTNLHQRKMNSVEEAMAYAKWMEMTGKSQSELAIRIGKKTADISNLLKLLKLDPNIQLAIVGGQVPKVLGLHLASYPEDRHKELLAAYNETLAELNGKIPSANVSQWVAKTLRKIAEQKNIKPLKPKKGRNLKSFSEMVFISTARAADRFRNNLDELEEITKEDIQARKKEVIQLISNLRLLAEDIEDTCLKLEGRLGK